MKIGTFARKFNLNPSTIRFYAANGLLTPTKVGGQYEFDQECVRDMEKIIKYKRYSFSLEEIQLLFFMEKASRFKDEVIVEVCRDILQKKRAQLVSEAMDLSRFIGEIDAEIESLPTAWPSETPGGGVPFSVFPYLYCPDCQVPLRLDGASLSQGAITAGELSCECGYRAQVRDGILVTGDMSEETPFKAFENVESLMAMKDQLSPLYRRLVSKAYLYFLNRLQALGGAHLMLLTGPFTFNFLLEFIEKLGRDNTFIVFDPSLKRIQKLKKYLSALSPNLVFVVGMPGSLPLRKESMDVFLDDYCTVNSLFTYNTYSTEELGPLLRPGGEVLGIFTSYSAAPASLANFRLDHPGFLPERMNLPALKEAWRKSGVRWTEQKSVGRTTAGESHFDRNAPGETIEVFGYNAKKEGKPSL